MVLRVAAGHGIPVPALEEDLLGGDPEAGTRRLRGALMRAIQMTGAMDAAVDLTVQHAAERKRFGRPLAAFQAVQQLTADAAAEAALARAATDAALAQAVATRFAGEGLLFSVAVARSVCGHSGSTVVRNAHQVHGAIGTTREHILHRLTMPILAWTNDFGSVTAWDALLEAAAGEAGNAGLWDSFKGRTRYWVSETPDLPVPSRLGSPELTAQGLRKVGYLPNSTSPVWCTWASSWLSRCSSRARPVPERPSWPRASRR